MELIEIFNSIHENQKVFFVCLVFTFEIDQSILVKKSLCEN